MEKATGIHVYQGDKGGWFADITFDDMPAGVSPCIGTPVHQPHRTREEAMDAGLGLVEFVMALDRTRDQRMAAAELPDGMVAFLFHGVAVPMPMEALDALRIGIPQDPPEEYVLGRLDEMTRELGDPEEVDGDMVMASSPEFKMRLMPIAAMALLCGVLRWPPFEEASPHPTM